MVKDTNVVVLVGRLTRDPEMRASQGGDYVTRFSLAYNQWGDKTGYVDCVAFKKKAEIIHQHAVKGSQLIVTAELDFHSWENNKGERRTKLELSVSDFSFVGPKPDRAGQAAPEAKRRAQQSDVDYRDVDYRDIPF